MFQDNNIAVKADSAASQPFRTKRSKSFKFGAALVALTLSQAAIAQEACPEGPKNSRNVASTWNIDKIRDFGLFTGSPEKQMMLCLHRGFHDNVEDNNSDFGTTTRGVPEHSWRSIRNAFTVSPCVELDFQKRYLPKALRDNGVSEVILGHETIADRFMANFTLVVGRYATLPAGVVCDASTYSGYDVEDNRTVSCYAPSTYVKLGAGAGASIWAQPRAQVKFDPSVSSLNSKTNISAMTGSLRTFYDTTNKPTYDGIVNQKGIMEWVNRCRGGGKLGLIVADIKTYDSLVSFTKEMEAFMAPLSVFDKVSFAKHWMIKTKPWKMRPRGSLDNSFADLKSYVKRLKNLNIPVIDTVAQTGSEFEGGAIPNVDADYALAKDYFYSSTVNNTGSGSMRALELVVPGGPRSDPIRANNQDIWVARDCSNPGPMEKNLSQISGIVNDTCHNRPRSGATKSYHPQIWGWVPLEDGRANAITFSTGATALPTLPDNKAYLVYGFEYPFGVASGNAAPFPFVLGRDTEERRLDYGPYVLGARAMTIDSISRFREQFISYTTSQQYFVNQ